MKKLMSLMLAAAITAGGTALLNPQAVKASAEAAVDNTIKTVAHYEFNDANNIGKDSSTNGFDLLAKDTSAPNDPEKGVDWGEEEGKTFAKLRRTYTDDKNNDRGGILYAQAVSGSKDFSDLVSDSFTLSIEFRGVNVPEANGSYYLLQTGKYNGSLGIAPWNDHIEYQPYSQIGAPVEDVTSDEAYNWTQTNRRSIPTEVNGKWHTLTISADADTGSIAIYYNGVLYTTLTQPDAKIFLSSGDLNRYTFCLNGQCESDGGANTMYGSFDIADVRVYDIALSEANVTKLYNGEEAVIEEGMVYATEIKDVQSQLDAVDTKITDRNKMTDIINALPKTVRVNTSDGSAKKTNIVWYKANEDTIKCYLQGKGYSNVKQLSLSVKYGYTVDFTYDKTLIKVTDVKINDEAFVPGTMSTKFKNAALTFKIEKLDPTVQLTGFYYDNMEYTMEDVAEYMWDEELGCYYIDVSDGLNIEIYAQLKKGTVTYYDGETSLGTTTYTEGGTETLMTAPEKEGYTFAGWYTDKELKNKFTGLDYTDAHDITLYAKYTKNSSGKKSGCGGSVNAELAIFGLLTMAAATMFVAKRKEN